MRHVLQLPEDLAYCMFSWKVWLSNPSSTKGSSGTGSSSRTSRRLAYTGGDVNSWHRPLNFNYTSYYLDLSCKYQAALKVKGEGHTSSIGISGFKLSMRMAIR